MVGDALVEQQLGRSGHFGRLERADLLQGLLKPLALHEPAAEIEPHVGGQDRRSLGIGHPGEAGQHGASPRPRAEVDELGHARIDGGEGLAQAVQQLGAVGLVADAGDDRHEPWPARRGLCRSSAASRSPGT